MAAKGLYIDLTEQGFTVRGVNNNFFPDNATLAYPANSVILITDESDMATFRSASNYDVLFSALIKDIDINGERVTKDNIISKFNEAANKPMSNPDAFTSVEYDGKNDLIFYNDKGEEVAKVDVTPFIKDGMIEDVEISDGNLVIHFNTDSDIKDIYIPLTEIFDPEVYYTKQEIDNQVNDIWNTIDTKEEVISTALNEMDEEVENLSNDKADTSALTAHTTDTNVHFTDGQKSKYDGFEGQYYNEDHWDIMPQSAFNDFAGDYSTAMGQFDQRITANTNAIGTKADASNVYTKTESDAKYATQVVVNEEIASRIQAIRDVNTALEGKADKSDTYTKAQVDTALASKANSADLAEVATSGSYNDLSDKPTIPTVPTNVSAFTNDAGYLTQHQSLSDYYTKTETDNAIATAMEGIDLSDYVDVTTFNKKELATAKALTQLNDTKADKTELPDVSTLATKTELNAKQDALQYYSEAEYENGGGRGLINVNNGKTHNASVDAEVGSMDSQTYASLYAQGDAGINTLYVTPTNVTINDAKVLTENDININDLYNTIDEKEEVIATALTQLNQDVSAIDAKEEVIASALTEVRQDVDKKANTADLATVATSGSYNDLSDKPVIPDTTNLATKSEVEALEPYAIDLDAYVANGITEAQYDEIVQAVSDGRVIKATYETRDYIVESVYVDGDVMKISLSDELKHRFFQFGRSTGTVSPTTAEYVSLVEKGVWNTKANASDVYTKSEIDAMIGNINTILASI